MPARPGSSRLVDATAANARVALMLAGLAAVFYLAMIFNHLSP